MKVLKKIVRFLFCSFGVATIVFVVLSIIYFTYGFITKPHASEQDMYKNSDTYIVHFMYDDKMNKKSYFDLQDLYGNFLNGQHFTLITDLNGPKKFDFYTIDDELVLVENNKLNLILEERGID